MKNNKGFLVAIEGIDGCGKTTFHSAMMKAFQELGHIDQVWCVSTFDTCNQAIKARKNLVDPSVEMTNLEMRKMMVDLHNHNFDHYVVPKMQEGKVVIIDRSIYSTLVYQATEHEIVGEEIHCYPDLTILLDLKASSARDRLFARRGVSDDRIENQSLLQHQNYRELYRSLMNNAGFGKAIIIDNDVSVDELMAQAINTAKLIINKHNLG